jgi:hypothetical protein
MRCQQRRHVQPDVPQGRDRRSILASCPVVTALVALTVAFPPLVTKPSMHSAESAQSYAALNFSVVDRSRKGDRLVRAASTFTARWDMQDDTPSGTSARPARLEKPSGRQVGPRIPFGCDPAFGPLVRANFSARCLAGAETRTQVAAAE